VPLNKQYDAIVIDDPALRVIGRVVFYQPQGEVL
jgi:SOS-response transcriptional repressor LexA